jgi:predicted nucleic acid-binding protein
VSKRRLLDTNLIVRHLTQDHEKHAKIAGRIFEACDRGELELVILPSVLAECVFVLDSFYGRPRTEISVALRTLISSPGIEIHDPDVNMTALERFEETAAHFVDCVVAATAAARGIPVATFDRGFRQFPDVRVELD